jgi:hypothetical protein
MSTPTPSLSQQVVARAAGNAPKGFTGARTNTLDVSYFHGMLYGETDSRKTVTAASFGGPERTFILLTRSPEQLIPIRSGNYHYARIEDGRALAWALQFPAKAADAAGFPEWKDREDRVLMVDDMTEGASAMVDDNSTRDDGTEVKDGRQIYKAVNDDLRSIMTSLKKQRMHLIFTALAKVAPSQIANEETVFPDMPSGARSIICADLEFIFFMKKATGKMLTAPDYLTFVKKDEKTGKPIPGRREVFAKNKIDQFLVGRTPPVLSKEEQMDLVGVWSKIQAAAKSGAVSK